MCFDRDGVEWIGVSFLAYFPLCYGTYWVIVWGYWVTFPWDMVGVRTWFLGYGVFSYLDMDSGTIGCPVRWTCPPWPYITSHAVYIHTDHAGPP